MSLSRFFILALGFLTFYSGFAQLTPIGNWREHLPYAQSLQVVNGDDKIWCATAFSIFSIDKDENSIDRISKVNGLNETGIRAIGWDAGTLSLVIAYENSNIDIVSSSGIKNINAVKNSSQTGDKNIYKIYTLNNLAYLSTGIGIIVIDLKKYEVKDTYIIGETGNKIKINAVTTDNTHLYAATNEGLKKVLLSSPNLSDYRNWQLVSGTNGLAAGELQHVVTTNNQIIISKNDSLFIQAAGNWSFLYADGWKINSITISENKILLSEVNNNNGRISVLNNTGILEMVIQNNMFTRLPLQSNLINNDYWIADSIAGLSKYSNNSFQSYIPNSPKSTGNGQMIVLNNNLWATAGSITDNAQPTANKNGLFKFSANEWKNYNSSLFPTMDSLQDCIALAIDKRDETIWVGSYGGGLFSIDTKNSFRVFKQSSPLQPALFAPGSYRVSGLSFDEENNLWISNYGAVQNLQVRKSDGTWRSFAVPFPLNENAVSAIVIDDLNQKWIIAPKGQGLICFNHGASIDNGSDDQWKWFRTGKGNGNLPDNNVLCIASDKNSFIWIGTKQGVGIIQCPQEVFTTQGCEAILPIVQQDNFAGYLFRDEEVKTIAVDGANRKWVGTKNGIWLISEDGEKTIYRFTAENSPLPDNDINNIVIDPKNGEVFFSTAKGITSFRSTATEGGTKNKEVLVFPNPVPPGYSGTIAIRGLVNNAIVKITEMNGRLVYETRALGGQAIWNGKNYKGERVSSGVYMVFINDDTKQEKYATKIVFIRK
ncbi:MAG: two-component regulator propeller domain-containing protein [Chitinophagaceae bacterium]